MNLQKDILAKLLATENVTVVHDNVRTASFNVKDRILTLPIWQNMESYTYDHLVGHEVGHALYTPMEGWHESVSSRGAGFKSFLNVIEDARIERMIQIRYPGLRREFVKSYKKMLADGFFGDDLEAINNYSLIDRINVYFKCGASTGVKLTADEMQWVREIESAETWEQVVDIADRMYGAAKDEMEQQAEQQAAAEAEGDDEGDEENPNSEFFDDGDFDGEESDEQNGDAEGDDDDGEESEEDAVTKPSASDVPEEPSSMTDDALRNNIASEYDTDPNVQVYNLFINDKINVSDFIVGYKEVLNLTQNLANVWSMHWQSTQLRDDEVNTLYNEFMANNKKTINYLVKEFEMKKSAANYARAFVSKTGVIDPVLMNSYKYNDDIFRKATIVPDGKNHGMIMYLDWSGSMHKDMFNTIEQTLNLVYFCRQVNIPFRVYAFSDKFALAGGDDAWDAKYRSILEATPKYTTLPNQNFRLIEFFNSKMNKMQFARMTKVLLGMGKNVLHLNRPFTLSGTPLNTTLALAPSVYDLFQKTNKVDVVNTVFLTDGDSHATSHVDEYEVYDGTVRKAVVDTWSSGICGWTASRNISNLNDPVTKKKYKITRDIETKIMLKNYIARTGSKAIGYRIVSGNKNSGIHAFESLGLPWMKANEIWEELKSQKYVNIPNVGYTKFFALKGGKDLETANGAFQVASDAKKGQILRAFKKANNNKIVSRSLLNEFIKEVA